MDLFNVKKVKALEGIVMDLTMTARQSFQVNASREFVNRNVAIYPRWDQVKQTARYATTDDVYSIIGLLARTSAQIPLYSYLVTDDKALKAINYKGYDPLSIHQTKKLQTKAFTDLPETDKLVQILENPHFYMSKFEFREALHTLLLLQGEVIIYKIRQFQFDEEGNDTNEGEVRKLEFLESHNVVRRVGGFPHRITGYDYLENGIPIIKNIPPEDIIHIRYYKGIGPLQALHRRLHRMDAEMDVTVAQMDNGGVPGIIFDKDDTGHEVPVEGGMSTVANERKRNFYNYLANKANKGAPFMDAGDLGYIQIGSHLVDMMVADLEKIDFKKLCNAFRVSDRLFNNDATGSEISDDNAQEALYTRACMPDVIRERDAFIKGLAEEFNAIDKKKRTIREDLSEIQALQGDMLKMAQAVSALPTIVPNEIREMFHLERLEDPLMDKAYMKTGYVSMDALDSEPDLPLTEDYNKP